MSALLTDADLARLPDGTRVYVRWSGGNGPHEYELRRCSIPGCPCLAAHAHGYEGVVHARDEARRILKGGAP